jgi:transcriptional regulator with XRE-family HTH domain
MAPKNITNNVKTAEKRYAVDPYIQKVLSAPDKEICEQVPSDDLELAKNAIRNARSAMAPTSVNYLQTEAELNRADVGLGVSKDRLESPGREPNPMDIHVGSRVRLRRMAVGMSQEKLGEQMGLTFQQMQKYEKGTNRIGASRLYQMAQILDVPVAFFFQDAPQYANRPVVLPPGFAVSEVEAFLLAFLNSPDGLALSRAFMRITDPKVRTMVVKLVRTISDQPTANAPLFFEADDS